MKITRDEAGLLLMAIATRVRVLSQFMDDPVLGTCIDEADKKKFCAAIEGYTSLRRKIALSDKAMLKRETASPRDVSYGRVPGDKGFPHTPAEIKVRYRK